MNPMMVPAAINPIDPTFVQQVTSQSCQSNSQQLALLAQLNSL